MILSIYIYMFSHSTNSNTSQTGTWPHLVSNVVKFVDTYESGGGEKKILIYMLDSLSRVLPSLSPPRRLSRYFVLMERIGRARSVNPIPVLKALMRLVKEGKSICSVGSWSLGSRVLDVCRTIMEFHAPSSIQKSLGKLLRFVSEHFDDVDVRDRANLYRNILIHVREPRLSRILDSRSVSTSSRRADVKDFVPRNNAKIRNVDIARVLELRRIRKVQHCEVVVSDEIVVPVDISKSVFRQYEDALRNATLAGISNTIHIPFRLNFHGGEDDLDKLYVCVCVCVFALNAL
jgi:hypothetical protein